MKVKTGKSPKLREFKCSFCGKTFFNRLSPAEIASRKTFSCSMECKSKLNSISHRKGVVEPCRVCGKPVLRSPSKIAKGTGKYCSERCAGTDKYGMSISTDGYYIHNNKKIHRTIMENHIGRKLRTNEIVHHINLDKLDNRIENLQIVTRAEHNKIHLSYRYYGEMAKI